jgi:hypothetical protein
MFAWRSYQFYGVALSVDQCVIFLAPMDAKKKKNRKRRNVFKIIKPKESKSMKPLPCEGVWYA